MTADLMLAARSARRALPGRDAPGGERDGPDRARGAVAPVLATAAGTGLCAAVGALRIEPARRLRSP